jgi:hypothetical protein
MSQAKSQSIVHLAVTFVLMGFGRWGGEYDPVVRRFAQRQGSQKPQAAQLYFHHLHYRPWWLCYRRSHRPDHKNIRIEFDSRMHSRVIARLDGKEIPLGLFSASETVTIDGTTLEDFALGENTKRNMRETLAGSIRHIRDNIGAGSQTTLTRNSGTIQKTLMVTVYDNFPQMAFFKVRYTNQGSADVKVIRMVEQSLCRRGGTWSNGASILVLRQRVVSEGDQIGPCR